MQVTGADLEIVCPQGVNITIVYNAFLWPEQNWRMVITGQLNDLVACGLLQCAELHVALSAPSSHPERTYFGLESLLLEGAALVHSIPGGGRVRIVPHLDNSMEYPGLHTLWQLAQDDDEVAARRRIFLYFHTKGMVNHEFLRERVDHELFDRTILPWRRVAEKFVKNDSIRLVAKWPSRAGWAWVNFWWARGSYIKTVEKPALHGHSQRHYYESWVAMGNQTGTQAFSLCTCDFGAWDPHELGVQCVSDPQSDPKCAP